MGICASKTHQSIFIGISSAAQIPRVKNEGFFLIDATIIAPIMAMQKKPAGMEYCSSQFKKTLWQFLTDPKFPYPNSTGTS